MKNADRINSEELLTQPRRLYLTCKTRSKELADETGKLKSQGKDWNIM